MYCLPSLVDVIAARVSKLQELMRTRDEREREHDGPNTSDPSHAPASPRRVIAATAVDGAQNNRSGERWQAITPPPLPPRSSRLESLKAQLRAATVRLRRERRHQRMQVHRPTAARRERHLASTFYLAGPLPLNLRIAFKSKTISLVFNIIFILYCTGPPVAPVVASANSNGTLSLPSAQACISSKSGPQVTVAAAHIAA
jgi:hypothetical protein